MGHRRGCIRHRKLCMRALLYCAFTRSMVVTHLLAGYLAVEDHCGHACWSCVVSTTAYAIAMWLVVLLLHVFDHIEWLLTFQSYLEPSGTRKVKHSADHAADISVRIMRLPSQHSAYTTTLSIYHNTQHTPQHSAYTTTLSIHHNTQHIPQHSAYTTTLSIHHNTSGIED